MGGVLIGFLRIILGLMLVSGFNEYAPPSWGVFSVLLAVLLLSFVVTLVHELGHALAIWWQNGTVTVTSALGISYSPGAGRLSFKGLPREGDLGGFVEGRPAPGGWTRRQHGIVIAAGPLADAALALLALTASTTLAEPALPDRPVVAAQVGAVTTATPIPSSPPARLPATEKWDGAMAAASEIDAAPVASMLMVVAFVSALGNMLPYRGSDGAQLLALWRSRNHFPSAQNVR